MMDEITAEKPSQEISFGMRLRAAREGMNLTEKDAANRLHLSPRIITLLENENFADAPPVTFTRGYLRSYARLLNFSEQEINTTLENLGLTIQSSNLLNPIIYKERHREKDFRYANWITIFITLVLIALVVMWWNTHSTTRISDLLSHSLVQQNSPPPATIKTAPETPNATPASSEASNQLPTVPPSQQTAPMSNVLETTITPTVKPSIDSVSVAPTPKEAPAKQNRGRTQANSEDMDDFIDVPEPGLEH